MDVNERIMYQCIDDEILMRHPSPYIARLQRELFYLWMLLAQEGLLDEAADFMEAHRKEPTPFETCLTMWEI